MFRFLVQAVALTPVLLAATILTAVAADTKEKSPLDTAMNSSLTATFVLAKCAEEKDFESPLSGSEQLEIGLLFQSALQTMRAKIDPTGKVKVRFNILTNHIEEAGCGDEARNLVKEGYEAAKKLPELEPFTENARENAFADVVRNTAFKAIEARVTHRECINQGGKLDLAFDEALAGQSRFYTDDFASQRELIAKKYGSYYEQLNKNYMNRATLSAHLTGGEPVADPESCEARLASFTHVIEGLQSLEENMPEAWVKRIPLAELDSPFLK